MREVHVVATDQHGLITIRQLRRLGVDKSAVSRWVAAGRLHRIHRGVYAVGHRALSLEARWKAATLSCGEGSALSHRSAAALWRMLESDFGPIHISVTTPGGRAARDDMVIHRVPSLQSHDLTTYNGIPVTRPQRTLVDLRATIEPGELRQAVRQAEYLRLPVDAAAIVPDRAASELELRFLALCRRHRLPTPGANVFIASMRVDFLWRKERLVVETDGHAFHHGLIASQDDRARDAQLQALGYEVLRLTWKQVVDERAATAALVRGKLNARREALA